MELAALINPRRRKLTLPDANSNVWTIFAIVLMAALHINNAIGRAINWDEFYHYSQVEAFRAGRYVQPLQTLHSRLFAWTGSMPGNSIDHLIAARFGILLFLVALGVGIFALARRLSDTGTALLAVLMYVSAGFVLQHAGSFRADTMAAALLIGALALLAWVRLSALMIVLVAFLCAVATLETIKTILYAPAFLGLAWIRWTEGGCSRNQALRLVAIPVVASAIFMILYYLHAHSLGAPPEQEAVRILGESKDKVFTLQMPYSQYIMKAALMSVFFTASILMTPFLLWRGQRPALQTIALAALWLPITSLCFYHNTAAYYYVYVLAPISVACIPALQWFRHRSSVAVLAVLLALTGLAVWAVENRTVQTKQREVVNAADRIFNQPVAYFDKAGMLSRFPKANHFMTPWGHEKYMTGKSPTFEAIMQARTVPLIVENDEMLWKILHTTGPVPVLIGDDLVVLRDTYRHFWGPFWLAGEAFDAGYAGDRAIRVPGPYTIAGANTLIDGKLLRDGDVIQLTRGIHHFAAGSRRTELWWGERLVRPTPAPLDGSLWVPF